MTMLQSAHDLPIAMQGGVPPFQELSSDELDRVAGGTISWACEKPGTKEQTCQAADCD